MTAGRETLRIVLADDHTLFREGVRELLSTAPDLVVVADGASGTEAVTLVGEHHPDVLLLDVEMPGPSAGRVIQQARQLSPVTRVVVLTMHDDPSLVQELLESGASAYLAKTVARDELVTAVRSVCRRHPNVLLSVSRRTIEELDRNRQPSHQLSTRELDVLRLTVQALSNAQIAARLFISEGTVKRHLTNVYAKLGAVSRVDAVRKARRAGLVEGDG